MQRKSFTWSGSSSHKDERADESLSEPSAETQRQIRAAACQVASLIVFDDRYEAAVALPAAMFCNISTRYARAISFVSDASENDEVAAMMNQISHSANTPVNIMRHLLRAEFDINSACKETILRTNSLASKSFGLYSRVICRDYVCSHVLPLVRDIFESCNSLEINPDILCRQPEVLALPELQRSDAVIDAISRNSVELARCVSNIIVRMSSPAALLDLPLPIISILKFVGELSSEIHL
jgi:hypothetical protein